MKIIRATLGLCGVILISGCSQLDTKVQQIADIGNTNAQILASAYNKLSKCTVDAHGDFKKVEPCLKATPAPTPIPAIVATPNP